MRSFVLLTRSWLKQDLGGTEKSKKFFEEGKGELFWNSMVL